MQANSHHTMGATSGAGTVYPSGAPEVFSDVYFAHFFSFLSSVLWTIVCLFFIFLLS